MDLRDEIGNLLASKKFKKTLEDTIKLLDPVCTLINYCQDPKKNIADGTHMWLNLALPDKFAVILEKRIKKAISEVGYTAYFLHPVYKGLKLNQIQRGVAMLFLERKLDEEGKDELTRFLRDRDDLSLQWPEIHGDPITYWSQLQFLWPKLADFCLKIMIMPASTASIESLFSNWKYVHSSLRNRLSEHNSSLCVDVFHLSKHLKDGAWHNTQQKQKKKRLELA